MLRREFISLLGSTAAAWPLAAGAQQRERMRRIGVLMALSETDRDAKALLLEFKRGLAESGWTDVRDKVSPLRWFPGGSLKSGQTYRAVPRDILSCVFMISSGTAGWTRTTDLLIHSQAL